MKITSFSPIFSPIQPQTPYRRVFKFNLSNLNLIGLSLFIGALTLIFPLCIKTVALPSSSDPNTPEGFQSNERDSLFGDEGLNPFDLIHNARFRNDRTPREFQQETYKNIKDASAEFRRRQLELMLNQEQENSPLQPTQTPEMTDN